MIESLPSPGPDVVVLRASGTVTADDVRDAWVPIEAALDDAARVGFLLEAVDLEGVTAGAFFADLKRAFENLGGVRRLARLAVVADAAWLRAAARLEGALVPGLEARSFEADERDAAVAWLTAHTAPQTLS